MVAAAECECGYHRLLGSFGRSGSVGVLAALFFSRFSFGFDSVNHSIMVGPKDLAARHQQRVSNMTKQTTIIKPTIPQWAMA